MSVTRLGFAGAKCLGRSTAWNSPYILNMARSKLSPGSADSHVRAKRPRPGHARTQLSALHQFPSWEGLGVGSWRPGANTCLVEFLHRPSFGQNQAWRSAKCRRGDGSPSDSKCAIPVFSR